MKYELCFIISPLVAETEHPAVKDEVLGFLKGIKAEVISEPYFIGRKKLAFPIAKQRHGFYVFLEFFLEDKEKLKDLEVKLKHDKNILRHLIIKKEKEAVRSKVDPSRFADAPEAKTKAAPRKRRSDAVPRPRRLAPSPVADKKEDKIELGEMPQKLDEILEKGPKID
ncbi:MAG: 30S ribosomal protein S6 [Patescibacteria group bacterium]|nr:30S ribosomal protein S6 [Patescibacteria group bacterium]